MSHTYPAWLPTSLQGLWDGPQFSPLKRTDNNSAPTLGLWSEYVKCLLLEWMQGKGLVMMMMITGIANVY